MKNLVSNLTALGAVLMAFGLAVTDARAMPVDILEPWQVPNKVYASNLEQNANWDGYGNTSNGFNYFNSRSGDNIQRQVDALANSQDDFFFGAIGQPDAFEAELVFSASGDPNLYYERSSSDGGVFAADGAGLWANPLEIDNSTPPTDVGGVNFWEDPTSDGTNLDNSNRYSLAGDPVDPISGNRVAVWDYDPLNHLSTPLFNVVELATAIAALANNGTGIDPNLIIPLMDLDGMMTFTDFQNAQTFDHILFTVAPIAGIFDGGEIFTYGRERGVGPLGPAAWLFHGGHFWDTAFEVANTFGLASENVNALEAIPEPSTILLLGTGLIGLVGYGARRKTV